MSQLIEISTNTYRHVFHELVDHRTDDWLLMSSPWTSAVIALFYLYFVKVGPRYMKDKPAYNLDKIICVYNLFQIVSSAYIVIRALRYGWGGKYRLICEPVDYSLDPESIEALKTMWYYYLLKIIDLLDTVFFILRKKENQVTFLHVFHHAGMVLVGWIWTKFIPGGHASLSGTINSFVHVWMYTYYFITNTWPEYKKKMWWKRYLTIMQMVQFCIIIVHTLPVFFLSNCPFPKFPCFILLVQNIAFFMLFYNFYRKSYRPKKID